MHATSDANSAISDIGERTAKKIRKHRLDSKGSMSIGDTQGNRYEIWFRSHSWCDSAEDESRC